MELNNLQWLMSHKTNPSQTKPCALAAASTVKAKISLYLYFIYYFPSGRRNQTMYDCHYFCLFSSIALRIFHGCNIQ